MKRTIAFALLVPIAVAGAWAISACVGDEPAAVTVTPVIPDGGSPDVVVSNDAEIPDAGWSPANLGDSVVVWLDALDPSAVKVGADGGTDKRVLQWSDKSKKPNHFKAPQDSQAPYVNESGINNRRSIQFSKADSTYLRGDTLNGTQGAHAFLVIQLTAPVNQNGHWRFGDTGPNVCFFPDKADGGIYDGFGTVNRPPIPFLPADLSQPHVYSVVSTFSEWSVWLDGKRLYLSPDPNTVKWDPNRSLLGASAGGAEPPKGGEFLDGLIGELIIVNRRLQGPDLDALKSYLTTRWGIAQE